MKNLIAKTAMLIATGVFVVTTAQAEQNLMRVEIPFQFVAGETTFPAGTYIVKADNATRQFGIYSPGNTTAVMLFSSSAIRSERESRFGVLVFNSYGNVHILRKVWRMRESRGLSLPVSRLEREFAGTKAKGAQIAAVLVISR